jgi:hypothetical protein
MTRNDLIVATPWIVFGAVLAVVFIRLTRRSRAARRPPERSARRPPDQAGSGGAEPGRCGRGDVPAAPLHSSAGQETPGRLQIRETTCSKNNTPAQQ